MAEFKFPQWKPFTFIDSNPPIFYPSFINELLQKCDNFSHTSDIETLFWQILTLKYLKLLKTSEFENYYQTLIKYEVTENDKSGFLNPQLKYSKKKKNTTFSITDSDILSTYYILNIFALTGKLTEYLATLNGNRKKYLENYILDLQFHLKKNSRKSQAEILFYITTLYLLLGNSPRTIQHQVIQQIKPSIKQSKGPNTVFKLLLFRFFNMQDPLKESDLISLHQLQKTNGGFNFKNSTIADPSNTFWIVFTLETYSWFLPYRPGPIYSYLLSFLRHEYQHTQNDSQYLFSKNTIKSIFQLIVLYACIFDSLLNDVENLIFTNISKKGMLNADKLSNEGGFAGAENEIISLLNQKFQFKLEILDNNIVFRRYLNRLNPFKEKLAVQIRKEIRNSLQFDINEFVKNYNRTKSRTNRIKVEFICDLIQEMEQEFFFTGSLKSRNRFFFFHSYLYIRENFIEKIIVCDKQLNWQDIQHEKKRMEEILIDIFNMINEIKEAKTRILNDIESMILVGMNPEKIEEHMKFLIKNTLIDATFFRKTIETFTSEFVYLNPNYALNSRIKEWELLYSNLQSDFRNIRKILNIKLDNLKDEIQQRDFLFSLEKEINTCINQITENAINFEENFRQTFDQEYHRKLIDQLKEQLKLTKDNLNMLDKRIKNRSLRITSKKTKITQMRNKLINKWISHKQDITQLLAFYQEGFDYWDKSLSKFELLQSSFLQRINKVEKEIKKEISKNDYSVAFEMNRRKFAEIFNDMNLLTNNFEKEFNKKRKGARKLNPLYQALITEWNSLQYSLEALIQQKKRSFQKSITMDQISFHTENFQLIVESQITILNQKLIEFKKRFSSLIKHDENISQYNYNHEAEKLKKDFLKIQAQIKDEYNKIKKLKLNIDLSLSLKQFQEFEQHFNHEIQEIIDHYNRKEKIRKILKYAEDKNQNLFEIAEIAQILKMSISETDSLLKQLVSQNLLNARIYNKTRKIEIHNKNWRNYLKLKQESEIRCRELQAKVNLIQNYFNKAVINHEFLEKSDQLDTLIEEFNEYIETKSNEFETFIQDNQINTKNNLIYEEYLQFYQKINKMKEQVNSLQNTTNQAKEFEQILKDFTSRLEDFGNSIINKIEQEFQTTSKLSHKNHTKYLQNQWSFIQNFLDDILLQEKTRRKEIFQKNGNFGEIFFDIEDDFKNRIQNIMQDFKTTFQNYEEELKINEIKNLRQKMDEIVIEKQNLVGQNQRKIDLEIKNKIRAKEYIIAAKKLNQRAKSLYKILKNAEKEIKLANKEFNAKSKVFGIKYSPYILEEWTNFQKQFEESVISTLNKVYARELVLNFTFFSIKSFKEPFVPLKLIAENLFLSHDQVQHILMSLISEGMLSGKIDLEHDVYFEGTISFDDKSIARLEIIKKTNVKTYLRIRRLVNVFAILGPILTGFASFLTILWYLIRLATNLVFIAIPIAVLIILFIYLWIRKGREQFAQLEPESSE